jgi:hypothetical protein
LRRSSIEQFVLLVAVESVNFSAETKPPMTPPFRVGDRVRLTPNYPGKQFHAGDTGTIVDVVPASTPQGKAVYRVRLDAGKATVFPTFHEDELERV